MGSDYALRPEALEAAIAKDPVAGLAPAIITSPPSARRAREQMIPSHHRRLANTEGMSHHVDAPWAGSAMCLSELRHHQAGVDRADSYPSTHTSGCSPT